MFTNHQVQVYSLFVYLFLQALFTHCLVPGILQHTTAGTDELTDVQKERGKKRSVYMCSASINVCSTCVCRVTWRTRCTAWTSGAAGPGPTGPTTLTASDSPSTSYGWVFFQSLKGTVYFSDFLLRRKSIVIIILVMSTELSFWLKRLEIRKGSSPVSRKGDPVSQ